MFREIITVLIAIAAMAPWVLPAQNAGSETHRLIGGANASVAARATSPQARLAIAGGSGAATGLSASPNTSANSGQQSTQLPTDRLFVSGLED
jgi:hypothetical protein